MASANIEHLLGAHPDNVNNDLAVAFGGEPFSFDSKVIAFVSSRRGVVDLL